MTGVLTAALELERAAPELFLAVTGVLTAVTGVLTAEILSPHARTKSRRVPSFVSDVPVSISARKNKITAGHKFESDSNVFISARKNKITAVNTLVTAVNTLITAFCTQINNSGSNNCTGGTKNSHSGTIFGVFRTNVCASAALLPGQVFLLASLAMVPPAQTVVRNHRRIPFFRIFRGGVRVVRVEKTPAGCSNCPAGVPTAQTVTRKRRHKRQIAQTITRIIPKIVPE